MGALSTEKIRFQLIGMSAAVLQGVPVATFDVDLWLDLPSRQYPKDPVHIHYIDQILRAARAGRNKT